MRNRFAPFLSFLFIVVFLLCPQAAADGVRTGIHIALESALPALFPFFIASALLVETGGAYYLTRLLYRPFWRLYGLEAEGVSALILGLLGGYPVGPTTVATLVKSGQISTADASRLMGFCSIASPAFCINLCGIMLFGSVKTGFLIYFVQVAATLLAGLLLTRRPKNKDAALAPLHPKGKPRPFATSFCRAVAQAARTSVTVVSFIVIFSVLLELVSPMFGDLGWYPIAASAMEVTAGVVLLPSLRLPAYLMLPLIAVLLGFGGLSVQLQAHAFLDGTGVPMRRYTLGRILTALLAGLLSLMLCQMMPTAIPASTVGASLVGIPHWSALLILLLVIFASLCAGKQSAPHKKRRA